MKAYKARYRKMNLAKVEAGIADWRRRNPERVKASVASYYEANKDKIVAYQKSYHASNRDKAWREALKRRFGIQAFEYEQFLRAQNGACAICSKPETAIGRNGLVRRLSVDHDHRTGHVRGLLCARCNSAIGLFKDDDSLLMRAAAYVSGFIATTIESDRKKA